MPPDRGKRIFVTLLEYGTLDVQEEDGHNSFSVVTGHGSIHGWQKTRRILADVAVKAMYNHCYGVFGYDLFLIPSLYSSNASVTLPLKC
jgi:hypothetical protein